MTAHAPLVIGLGELLWDVFPERRLPGGAPANVAFQAAQLGLDGTVASRLGCDPLGDELLDFLAGKSLDTSLIQRDPVHPTGQVTVDLSDEGHPDYVIHENAAWDFLEPHPALLDAAGRAAAVCFGTLAQRCPVSREAIHTVLSSCPEDCLIVYDVNLRQRWYDREWIERSLHQASIVKLNREEAIVLGALLDIPASGLTEFATGVLRRFEVGLVCITRAEDGCLLVGGNETTDVPGRPVRVIDAVGAGDAFSAALIASRLWKWPLARSAEFANAVGGLVASHPGAMPSITNQLAALRDQHAP
ncbi:MAG: carbohydrate kinase [Planctomycetaceae bacterium]